MQDKTNWAIAVYLAGGEGLSAGMIRSLQDLRDRALTSPDLDVVAQFEPRNKIPRLFAFPGKTGVSGATVPSPRRASTPNALENYEFLLDPPEGGGPPSSRELLGGFIARARDLAVAENFMLVFSGHGNGAVGELFGCRGADRALQITDLRPALRAASRATGDAVDVIGMDCCNMSMIEVGFELAPHARYLVASESVVPSYGWPYRQILERIHDRSAEDTATEIVRQYIDFYADYRLSGVATHCAAVDLQLIDGLAAPVRRLAETLLGRIREPDVWRPVVLAHWEAQSYKNEEYVDLADFCERLYRHVGDPDIRRASVDVMEAVGDVVVESRCTGASFQFSTGLSVYFPWCNDHAKDRGETGTPSDLDGYQQLDFSRQTRWGEFLDAYLEATRREARPRRPIRHGERVSPALELAASCAVDGGALSACLADPAIRDRPQSQRKEVPTVDEETVLGVRRARDE